MKNFFALLFSVILLQIQAGAVTIPQGTLVVVKATKMIDADEVKFGDTVTFTTVQPVKVNENVVFKMGTEVLAKVVKVKNNGILGIPGEIEIGEFQIVTPDNDVLRLSGNIVNSGEGRYWANAGWIIIFPILFIKGNDGKITTTTTHMLYTAEDFDLKE